MIKPFLESLRDGFRRIKPSGGAIVKDLRSEGVLIDEEGYFSYAFGQNKEYELCLEPLHEDENDDPGYLIALYKNRVLLINKLPIWLKNGKKEPTK